MSPSDKKENTVTQVNESVKVKLVDTRKFLQSWKFGRPWLKFNASSKLMFCDVCEQAQVHNSFTVGCGVLKKECVTKHEKGSGENSHSAAIEMTRESSNMQAAREVAMSKNKGAILSAMRNVVFAAEHNLSNVLIPHLNDLCVAQGASELLGLKIDGHTTYEHHSSISQFQQSLVQAIDEKLIGRVSESGGFSIMLDESTDVSVHQNMVVYIRYLIRNLGRTEARTEFLGIRQLSSATSEHITKDLIQLLDDYKLDVKKMVGLSTDGAAVMVGCRKGVVTKLREICPGLVATHCIAHRLALASGSAANKVRYLVKFQEILNSMFKYFSNSPKNMARLEKVQAVVEKMKGTRLKQVFHTRWLSFEGCVKSVIDNCAGLVSVFLEDNSAKALAMHKPITCYKFLYTAHFLADVLNHLAILCKAYQRTDIDFTHINPLLESTVNVIMKLRDEKSGEYLNTFLSVIPPQPQIDQFGLQTFEFKGHTIRDSTSQRLEAVTTCDSFVNNIVNNLNDRFTDEGDAAILSALTNLFDPILNCTGISEETITTVTEYLGQCGVGEVKDCKQEVVSFLAYLKVHLGKGGEMFQSVRDVAQLCIKCKQCYPLVAAAAERLLLAPVTTVDCERGFSRQNLIKTAMRNSLSIQSLQNIMKIGLKKDDIDYECAFNHWSSVKQRRILFK